MSGFLIQTDSWIIAAILAGLMLAAWFLGCRRGARLSADERKSMEKTFSDASMAILGLLLAFTFSMTLSKHDQRRQMVVLDSNAIGDFYTCASLLKQPVRGQLQAVVHDYVEVRLAIAKTVKNDADLELVLAELQRKQARMQALVGEAVDAGTPIVEPLVDTLNALTSNHAARLAAVRDRLPASIILLLFVAALVTMALIGTHQGASGERRHGATLGFVLLVSLVAWVILDLNQPERGMITVSQEPMQRVLKSMQP